MGEIILLEELMDEVLTKDREHCSLVGKREWVKARSKRYDFLFHAVDGVPYEDLRDNGFFYVPYLSYDYPEGSDQARLHIHEIHRGNTSLKTFATRYNKPKIFRSELGSKKRNKSLKFFDVTGVDIGTEIVGREMYHILSERDFEESMPNWPEIKEHLAKWRKRIDQVYQD